jgi:hypothetical protein
MARPLQMRRFAAFRFTNIPSKGSELMTTATAIQTRIAYALSDDHRPDDAIVEFLSHEIDGPCQTCELSEQVGACFDAKNVGLHSSEKGAVVATALTLDDFGGRSDALGG